jgi:hypothetical protein
MAAWDPRHRSGRVDGHDDLLGPEPLQDRPGLLVIVPQAALDCLRGVVGLATNPPPHTSQTPSAAGRDEMRL